MLSIAVTGAFAPIAFKDLNPGDAFYMPLEKGGYIIGLKGLIENSRIAVVVAVKGSQFDDEGAGYMDAQAVNEGQVIRLEGLRIDVDDGPGFGLPAENIANGGIVVDENGKPWLHTKNRSEIRTFDLETGEAGNPKRIGRYNRWRLLWDKPDADDPVVLHTFAG